MMTPRHRTNAKFRRILDEPPYLTRRRLRPTSNAASQQPDASTPILATEAELARRPLKFGSHRIGMYRLSMNRCARLIDHDNQKRAIGDPRIAAKSTGELLAMFDRAAGRSKLETGPMSRRSAVLHIKIVGPHRDPCSHRYGGMDCGVSAAGNPPLSSSHTSRYATRSEQVS